MKKLLERIIILCFSISPVPLWIKIRKKLITNHKSNFVAEIDFRKVIHVYNNCKLFRGTYYISKGFYDYEYFNICFLNNMLSYIISSVMSGMIPVINIVNSNNINLWNSFFNPIIDFIPEKIPVAEYLSNGCEIFPSWNDIYNKKRIRLWSNIYSSFVNLNEQTKAYIEKDKEEIFKEGRKVLGVIIRGTDYTYLKPKGHPIQPELTEVIKGIDFLFEKYAYTHIYLATEEKKIEHILKEKYGSKVLINKRIYYDEIFYEKGLQNIKDVHFDRDNDDYYKGLEYLSSIVILSKCQGLIGGNCGGAQAAIFMNNLKYQNLKIFNLGLYS